MNIETITTILGLVNNPLVQLGGAALLGLALTLAAYAIHTQPKVADVAQDLADLAEEVEPWVVQLEKSLLRGEAKYSAVLDRAEAWLLTQGITGRRGRVVQKYLPALIEVAVKKARADQKPAA